MQESEENYIKALKLRLLELLQDSSWEVEFSYV